MADRLFARALTPGSGLGTARLLAAELLDALYPRRCRLCGAAAADDLACPEHDPRSLARARCGRCAAPLPPGLPDAVTCAACRRKGPGLATTVSLGDYTRDHPLRDWVLALKHGGRTDLARPLAALLAGELRGGVRRAPAPGALLVPVPAHPLRRLERGCDQAWCLAQALHLTARLPVLRALVRTRATPPQGEAGARSRAANVRGAFRVSRRAATRLAGREVWLVDDVATSGATLRECARALRRAGARRVAAAVLARAAPRS